MYPITSHTPRCAARADPSGAATVRAVPESSPFVSRGGLKLEHALTTFGVDVTGHTCADFGCSTGGFVDCLLQRGAAQVFALDTAYGVLAWKLRNDPRVVVMERTNCLHAEPPTDIATRGGVDLVTIDASWTPQRLVIPAAMRWLSQTGKIITLIKPHYEINEARFKAQGLALPRGGVLDLATSEKVARDTAAWLASDGAGLDVRVAGLTPSPIAGGKKKSVGNTEWLALVTRA